VIISRPYIQCKLEVFKNNIDNRQLGLLTSLIQIVNIDNWYYCVHALLISTTGLVDISNVRTLLISTIPIVDITNAQSQQYRVSISTNNCGYHSQIYQLYQQFELRISTINCHCRYLQIELLISTIGIVAIGIVDINIVSTLSIPTIEIVNLTNTNCRYRQLVLLRSCTIDIDNLNC